MKAIQKILNVILYCLGFYIEVRWKTIKIGSLKKSIPKYKIKKLLKL